MMEENHKTTQNTPSEFTDDFAFEREDDGDDSVLSVLEREEGDRKMGCWIPEEWFEKRRKKRVSWKHILGLGIIALEDNPAIIERLNSVEKQVAAVSQRNANHSLRFYQVEEDLKKSSQEWLKAEARLASSLASCEKEIRKLRGKTTYGETKGVSSPNPLLGLDGGTNI
jgi:hypothetical protein